MHGGIAISNLSPQLKALWDMRLNKMIASLTELFELTKTYPKEAPLHKFVKGHILSSALIEDIYQDFLTQYSMSWGQILRGDILSKEIDIIIYEGKPYHE